MINVKSKTLNFFPTLTVSYYNLNGDKLSHSFEQVRDYKDWDLENYVLNFVHNIDIRNKIESIPVF